MEDFQPGKLLFAPYTTEIKDRMYTHLAASHLAYPKKHVPGNKVMALDGRNLGHLSHVHPSQHRAYATGSLFWCITRTQEKSKANLVQQRCEVVAERALFLSQKHQRQATGQRGPSRCARWKLSRVNQELKQLRASIEEERAKVPPFCGLAFVTFARPETQKQFLEDWGPGGCRRPRRWPPRAVCGGAGVGRGCEGRPCDWW